MKLSAMTTDQLCDTLCAVTPYVSHIAEDPDLRKVFGDNMGITKESTTSDIVVLGASKLVKMIPLLLSTHRDDVYGVLSVVNSKTVEYIRNQPAGETMLQIREVIMDEDLRSFFKSSTQQEVATLSAV